MFDDAQLTRYLFGMLDEKEITAINEAVLIDDDLATSLAILEDELIDAYVRDELDVDSRTRFEATFLRTEYGQERVAVARTLVTRADRTPASTMAGREISPKATLDSKVETASEIGADVVPMRPRRPWGRWLAVAAMIMVALAAVYRLQFADPVDVPGAVIDQTTLVVALVPPVRGTPSVPVAELAPHTRSLRFEVDLEATSLTPGDRLSVRLESPESIAVYETANLAPIIVAGAPALMIEVPTAVLGRGRYLLLVDNPPKGQHVGRYEIDIRRWNPAD